MYFINQIITNYLLEFAFIDDFFVELFNNPLDYFTTYH
ncbi:hypothetical protein MNB_SV-15-1281 [hydrothermal vent metagenome]|uniref:Uncharacterized protein n=1 Tax=hydrothermal vent metagenome TaxID=652676 RepID=A0A1W1EKB1_9ZZZZ